MLSTPTRFADRSANFAFIDACTYVATHRNTIMAWSADEPDDFKVFTRDGAYCYRVGCEPNQGLAHNKMCSFVGAHGLGRYTPLHQLRSAHARELASARSRRTTGQHPLLVVCDLNFAARLRHSIAIQLAERRQPQAA